MTYTPFIWPLICAAVLLSGLGLYARRNRASPAAGRFQALMWLTTASAVIYLHEITVNDVGTRIYLSQIRFIPLALIPPTVLIMALEYSGRGGWLARNRWLYFYLIPGLAILLSLTGGYHHLFRYDFVLNQQAAVSAFLFRRGAGWYVYYVYSVAASFGAAGVLFSALRQPRLPKRNTLALILGVLLTLGVDILYVLNLTPIRGYYWTPSAFVMTAALFGWALLRGRLFELTPVSRNTVLQHVQDLALVLDTQGRLVDYNRSAAEAFGLSPAAIGLPLEQALPPGAGGLTQLHLGLQQGQTEARLQLNGDAPRWFDLTVSPIAEAAQRPLGQLMLLHDVSARQQAAARLQQHGDDLQQRLDSILSPDGDLDQAELSAILDTGPFQALLDDFYRLTQVGVAILDLHGNILAQTGWQAICTQFHRAHPNTLQNCLASNEELGGRVNPGEYSCVVCKNNLNYVTTPIFIGGRRYGVLHLGQFFFEDEAVDQNQYLRQAKYYGFDQKEYLAALRRVPRWSRQKVDQAMRFYSRLAGLISQLSFSNLQLAQTLEREKRTLAALQASEARYRLLAENVNDVIWTMDAESRFTYISPSIRYLRGLTPEEALQESLADSLTPESLAIVTEARRKRAALPLADSQHIPLRMEVQQKRRDGSLVWVEIQTQRLLDEQGRLTGYLGVSRDISERKRNEQALAQEQALLQHLMDTLPDRIYFKDLESRFIRINRAQAVHLGLDDPTQAIGKSDADFFSAAHAQKALQDERRILLTGEALVESEELLSWPDGTESWAATTKLPLYDSAGQISGAYGVSRDISARKQAEQQIKEALAQKETLLRETHHRVKNNLAVVTSLLEMQAITSGDERLRTAFKESQRRIQAMARIHEQLYRAQDLQMINMKLYLEAFADDLRAYDVLSQVGVVVEAQPVALTIDQAIPCGLIMNELVTNALKYAFSNGWGERSGGARPQVQITFGYLEATNDGLDGRVRLEVSDNGAGLPAAVDLERPKHLGLRLVTRLADQLHGELHLNTSPDQGAQFVITFPVSNCQ